VTDFIEVYDNALSSDVCKTVIDYMNILPRRRVTKEGLKDAYYTTDTLLNEPSPHTISLVNALHGCVSKYVEKHHQLKRTNSPWIVDTNYCLQKYDPNMGYYKSHAENTGLGTISIQRMLVWMIYLNTVTDDGGTYFENYDRTLDAVEGRCVIWPAFWTHFHNGIVSKTQTKYIATGWFVYDSIHHK